MDLRVPGVSAEFRGMVTRTLRRGALAGASMLAATGAGAQSSGDWALHGHDLGGQRFSPLAAIDTRTVARLVPKWTFHSGVRATFQATPIVREGVMYVSLPFSGVVALDAATGQERWRYTHASRTTKLCCGPANRGVAVGEGMVYVGTVDGRLVALDAATGAVRWDVTVAEYEGTTEATSQLGRNDPLSQVDATGSTGVGISAAPLVFDGKVFVGIAGVGYGLHPDQGLAVVGVAGRYGRPGMMAAFDARTGRRVWRWDVTGPGWEGRFRASAGDRVPLHRDLAAERAAAASHKEAWRYGGGSIYATPVIDTARHLLIFGTGNPSPQMADGSRPGDNLYTSSLVALDLRTGRLVWHYQQVPHDRWGYDVASAPVLLDLARGGARVPAVAQASKTGWVFVHDRRTGALLLKSEPFVPQRNLFTPPRTGEGVVIAPGIAGGANWSPSAYDPGRRLFFVGALHLPTRYIAHEARRPDGSTLEYASTQNTEEAWGTLTALDLGANGRRRWQVRTEEPLVGGVLATAGGLVFSGAGKQRFAAYDAGSGRELWSYVCDAGVNAPPVTYSVGETQYVAVAVGGNALFGFTQGDAVMAFSLSE
ncbi:MAG TPA: PQQ-binding-like beta-propeller repeat protein [Gemmatimonadales bacterium]|nr:PQQ-binding-like beta-propeller repeat protein [Gemmatimonadales bacterium]